MDDNSEVSFGYFFVIAIEVRSIIIDGNVNLCFRDLLPYSLSAYYRRPITNNELNPSTQSPLDASVHRITLDLLAF